MTRKSLAAAFVFGSLALAILLLEGFEPSADVPEELPQALGRNEGCLLCHAEMKGFSPAHDPAALGCSSCHLGNAFTSDKKVAHRDMVLIPGNLNVAAQTCGDSQCHPQIAAWVEASLMASGRGLVTVNRYVFGESDSPDGQGHLSHLGHTPADSHLRHLCASCHLALPRQSPGPITESSRGGGCNACHLLYSPDAAGQLSHYLAGGEIPNQHPALSVKISSQHCFGCHSRSGRISTNYEGWHETLGLGDFSPHPDSRLLEDGRIFERQPADVHHVRGMQCLDCHTWRETMATPEDAGHQEQAVEISCSDCHFPGEPRTAAWSELSTHDQKILRLWDREDQSLQVLATRKNASPLLNTVIDATGRAVLLGRDSKQDHPLNPPLPVCGDAVSGHQRLSCQSCHSRWAPYCADCHTVYDDHAEGFDHLKQEWKLGGWVEEDGGHLALPPALGIQVRDGQEIITPFIPGMIMTLAGPGVSREASLFRRLYAPTSPHTTVREARDCRSCHNDAQALGLGLGLLVFSRQDNGQGAWVLYSQRLDSSRDGLPEDAWTGLFSHRQGMVSTREGARPLTPQEQWKVLRVGACLTCHEADDVGLEKIYGAFSRALERTASECLLPEPLTSFEVPGPSPSTAPPL